MRTLTPNEPTFFMRPFVAAHNAKKRKGVVAKESKSDDSIPRAEAFEALYRQAQEALNEKDEALNKKDEALKESYKALNAALEGEKKAKKALKAVAPDLSRRVSYSELAAQAPDLAQIQNPRSNSTPLQRGNYGTGWRAGSSI